MKRKLTCVDLFSGAGGLSRGFYDAGYDVVLGVDFEMLDDRLCQTCLDILADFYEDQINDGDSENNGCSGYCLIDFQTKELYRLSEPYRGYTIDDYYVKYDIWEEGGGSDWHRISVFIAYLPERVSN